VIRTFHAPLRAAAIPVAKESLLTSYNVRATSAGSAILTTTRDRADHVTVTGIDRLPSGLDPCARWLRDHLPERLAVPRGTQVVVDADGLGQALFDHVRGKHRRGWRLYEKHGRDRQELVNALLVAEQEQRILIRPGNHGDAMRKALLGYRREVGDDGSIGAELVVALALAVVWRRPIAPKVR